MTPTWLLTPLLLAAPAAKPPPAAVPVEFRPGAADSKLAPRFSPKGAQLPLAPHPAAGLPGFDHLEARVKLGPAAKAGGGLLVVLARSEKGKPYDRLFVDAGRDGSVRDDTPVSAAPTVVRDKHWTTFAAALTVGHAADGAPPAWEEYPVSFWVVADKPADTPAVVRYTRRGFRVGTASIGGKPHDVLLADADNDAVFGPGDSWAVRPAGATGGFGADASRAVGDYAWAGGSAWKLELTGTAGRAGRLVPFDPGVTEDEDARRRDRLRADRTAPRADKPVPFRADVDAAVKDARDGGRPHLLKFETDWCVPCKQMHAYVFTSKAVADAAEGVACVTVDGDKRKDLTEKYSVKGYPTGILFGPDGREVARFTGYQGVADTTAFFRKLAK